MDSALCGRPVVVTGALSYWFHGEPWSLARLQSLLGALPLHNVFRSRDGRFKFFAPSKAASEELQGLHREEWYREQHRILDEPALRMFTTDEMRQILAQIRGWQTRLRAEFGRTIVHAYVGPRQSVIIRYLRPDADLVDYPQFHAVNAAIAGF